MLLPEHDGWGVTMAMARMRGDGWSRIEGNVYAG